MNCRHIMASPWFDYKKNRAAGFHLGLIVFL